MDIRKVRENLGRIKVYYLRGETLPALRCAVSALTDLVRSGVSPSVEIRSLIREGAQALARDADIKARLKAPLVYQPGQERQLLLALASAYKQMEAEAGREDHDAALARKQRLDQALNLGQKLLAQGKVSEAEESFQEALKHYRDEHRVYQLIGKWLLEGGQPRRAAPYLKKAMELEPESAPVRELLASAMQARDSAAR